MNTLNDEPNHNFLVTGSSIVKGSFGMDAVCPAPWTKRICAVLFFLFCFWPPAAISAAQLTLAWNAVDDSDLADYRVYVRNNQGAYANDPVWAGQSTSCTIEDLLEDSSYCFVVRASNLSGNESGDSNEVCYSTGNDSNEIDTDGDGMPDAWETEMGLDPNEDDSEEDQDGDSISNVDEYEYGSDPRVAEDNTPPYPPSGTWPVEGAVVDSMVPELETDEFADADTQSSHHRTRWRIVRRFDNVCVFDGRSRFFLTSFIVPNWVLEPETEYFWQVKFYDDHGAASEWSAENSFETSSDLTDSDGNGVPDDQEVDQDQDLNRDGTPDAMQPDTIKCVAGSETNGVVGISINEDQENQIISGMSSGESRNYARILSEQVVVPFGLFEYKIEVTEPGNGVQVKVFLPSPAEENFVWHQLGIEGDWVDYGEYALFSSDRKSVTLELKDGGYGDIDGIENGIIIDRSGLILEPQSSGSATLPASMEWGGSGACFINTADRSEEVKRFYLWLAIAGIAMIVLSKIGAIWHDRFTRTKKAR